VRDPKASTKVRTTALEEIKHPSRYLLRQLMADKRTPSRLLLLAVRQYELLYLVAGNVRKMDITPRSKPDHKSNPSGVVWPT